MCKFFSFVQDADGNIYHLYPDIVVDVPGLPIEVHGKTVDSRRDHHSTICREHGLSGDGIAYEVVFGTEVGLHVNAVSVSDAVDTVQLFGLAHTWLLGQRRVCGKNFASANLRGADLRWANLRGANLYGADLRGANLYEANLRWANLRGANLYGADLRWANLRGADLRWADLCGADLRGADLSWADLCGAQWDDITRWPASFVPPSKEVNDARH